MAAPRAAERLLEQLCNNNDSFYIAIGSGCCTHRSFLHAILIGQFLAGAEVQGTSGSAGNTIALVLTAFSIGASDKMHACIQ